MSSIGGPNPGSSVPPPRLGQGNHPITGVAAGVSPDPSSVRAVAQAVIGTGALITPQGLASSASTPHLTGHTVVHVRPAVAPDASITATRVTAAKIDKFVASTIGGGAVRAHDMQPLQHESGVRALQGVVNDLWQLQGSGPGKVHTPGLDLSKPNPKFTIDFSRLVISYPVTVAPGKVERTEVSLREAMENTSEEGQALNNAMEALALESRGVVGEKAIQSQTLLQQCDRNYNKSPSLRRSASEPGYQQAKAAWKSATTPDVKAAAKKEMEKFKFQSKFPVDIAATKAELGITTGPESDRIDDFAKRLEKLQGALAHQITAKHGVIEAKQGEIQTKKRELAALAPRLGATTPDATAVREKATKEAEITRLEQELSTAERELKVLQADQQRLNDVDEFAVTLALAYSAPQNASPSDIDKAARKLRETAEGIYGKKYSEYQKEYHKPHYSFFGGEARALPIGTDLPAGPGIGAYIAHSAFNALKVTCDALGTWVGWQRVAPDRGLDDAAQYAAQYAGDVGALAYNQMSNSADERMQYASYCADQNIALRHQGVTDHVLSAFFAAEGDGNSTFVDRLLGSLGSGITPADKAAIVAKMDLPPPAATTAQPPPQGHP
jgi:hypothetical protein